MRVLNILWQASPEKLTVEEIRDRYKADYGHSALIGNRLRDLRKDGEAVSVWDEGKRRKLWTVSGKWRKPTKK